MHRLALFALTWLAAGCAATLPREAADEPHWSELASIPGVRPGTTLRYPSAAVVGDIIHVAGNLVPQNPAHALGPRPAVILRVGGTPLPLPEGGFSYLSPQLAADGTGRLHLFWSERSGWSPDTARWITPAVDEIWYSRHDRQGWSEPELVVTATRINWSGYGGNALVDASDRPHVAVNALLETGRLTLLHLSRADGGWQRADLGLFSSYAYLAAAAPDSLVLAASGATPERRSEPGIFLLHSSDQGSSWSEPELISTLTRDVGAAPVLARGPDGLHLIWRIHGSLTSDGRTIIEHRVRRTGATEWEALAQAPIAGWIHASKLADVGCDDVRLVVELVTEARVQLLEVLLGSETSVQRPVLPEYQTVAGPELVPLESEALLLATVFRSYEDAPELRLYRSTCRGLVR